MFQKNRVSVESLLGAGAIDCWAGLLGIARGDLFHHQPGRREVCDKGCASMSVAQCAIINTVHLWPQARVSRLAFALP